MRTRLVVGNSLAAFAIALLVGDSYLAPWFPVLFAALAVIAVVATRELVSLFPAESRPATLPTIAGVLVVMAANWAPLLVPGVRALEAVFAAVVAVFMVAVLVELARYREPGGIVVRLALVVFAVAYLGLLGSAFAQLRWLTPADAGRASWLLGLAIFIPKGADTGAYFAGRAFGRRRMTPLLSPKKTWEGLAGGLAWAALTAVGFHVVGGGLFGHGMMEAVAFGLVVGSVGVLGDLAESLVKRDAQAKDAAASIPGFGGLLDVVDSILFAAPVALLWFVVSPPLVR